MLVNLRPWSISHVSSHTFLLASATPATSLELLVGGRPEGPWVYLDIICHLY